MEKNQSESRNKETKPMLESSGTQTNRIMGLTAIFISVLSLVAVCYQSYLSREENEMMRVQQGATVLPYLSQWYSDVDGKVRFVLANKGVGPAFIKDIEFRAFDVAASDSLVFDSSDGFIGFMTKKSKLLDSVRIVKYSVRPNILLSKGETINVFSFYYQNEDQEMEIKKEFNKYYAGFSLRYEDVYGSAWILDSQTGFPEKLPN